MSNALPLPLIVARLILWRATGRWLLIFLAAGTLHYWQAWLYVSIASLVEAIVAALVVRRDPNLARRRLKMGPSAEPRSRQKIVMRLVFLFAPLALIIAGLDHRFGWSRVPWPCVLAADALLLAGMTVVLFVLLENTFAASVVAVVPGQTLIATGPYALVRHPMYSGFILMNLAVPTALASWWAWLSSLVIIPALVARLLDEEHLLRQDLPRYPEYCHQVPFRLIPRVW